MSLLKPHHDRRSQAGFTLLEVVVALAACAVIIGALTMNFKEQIVRTRQAEARLMLQMAAQTLLSALPARAKLQVGTSQGRMGLVDWTMQSIDLGAGYQSANGLDTRAYQIKIDLRSEEGQTFHFETIRLGARPITAEPR